MEIACLEGLAYTIERCRPHIFIEVDNENAQAFFQWCKDNRYSILERHRNYTVNENFMTTADK